MMFTNLVLPISHNFVCPKCPVFLKQEIFSSLNNNKNSFYCLNIKGGLMFVPDKSLLMFANGSKWQYAWKL